MKRKLWDNEEAVSPVIAVILMVAITVVLAAVLYVWASSFLGVSKQTPQGALSASKVDEQTWTIQIVKMNPTVSVNSVDYFLLNTQGNTESTGTVADIYGYYLGNGKGIVFADNDFNGKLSPGDMFTLHAGEKGDSAMKDLNNLNDYKFRLKFKPTDDSIGVDITLA